MGHRSGLREGSQLCVLLICEHHWWSWRPRGTVRDDWKCRRWRRPCGVGARAGQRGVRPRSAGAPRPRQHKLLEKRGLRPCCGLGGRCLRACLVPDLVVPARDVRPLDEVEMVHLPVAESRISCDNRIRNLLDGVEPAAFDPLFRLCLETVGALEPFQRLDERLPVALEGIRFHCSDTSHCPRCSVRHAGSERRPHPSHHGRGDRGGRRPRHRPAADARVRTPATGRGRDPGRPERD